MRTAAIVFGALGGAAVIMGALTVGGVIPEFTAQLTWMFWFALGGVLLLSSIAFAVCRGRGEE
ncbi:MAG: hypothetical protein JSW24_02470 [Dehalococcoidia bacterium]|nr:MAG: hypothetical protein JSW24_02470 [Dehalococcoidia bacterium]